MRRQRVLLIVMGLAALAMGWGVFSGRIESTQLNEVIRRISDMLVRRAYARYGGYQIDIKKIVVALYWVSGTLLILLAIGPGKAKRGKPAPDPLDRILFTWSPHDPFTVRDLLNGGVSILGRAGSGKT